MSFLVLKSCIGLTKLIFQATCLKLVALFSAIQSFFTHVMRTRAPRVLLVYIYESRELYSHSSYKLYPKSMQRANYALVKFKLWSFKIFVLFFIQSVISKSASLVQKFMEKMYALLME